MEFKIENTQIYGLTKSIIASGNAMRVEIDNTTLDVQEGDKHFKRACSLGSTKSGEGHDQFLTGIIVQFDLYAPLFMLKQLQRYHFLDFISSQSTMHRLTKFNIKEQCVSDVDEIILERYQELLDYYNLVVEESKIVEDKSGHTFMINKTWRTLVASLPCGFVLGATMTTNYRQLKTIYHQRKHHKLKEWHDFCNWCESLPYFKQLCLGV